MINLVGPHFASFCDLEYQSELLNKIESFSDRYLDTVLSNKLWPQEYPWPLDSLHTNTRLWEYPFVMNAISNYSNNNSSVLDVGSALTFFPYYLNSEGFVVTSIDIDVRMEQWSEKIREFLLSNKSINEDYKIQYLTQNLIDPIMIDGQVDIVTNISVVEHISAQMLPRVIDNIYNVLRKDGIFICTMDVLVRGEALKGHLPLNTREFKEFFDCIGSKFNLLGDYSVVAPIDLITNIKYHPSPHKTPIMTNKSKNTTLKSRLANAINGFKGIKPKDRLEWTAFGCTFRKK